MQFYVTRNGEQLGPFSLMDVRQHLQSGALTYSDLAWRDGMKDWAPLSELMGGALPDATPHAVSTSDSPAPRVQAQTPTGLRIVTAIVLFIVFFIVIYIVVAMVAFMVGGSISGARAAADANAQSVSAGYSVGLKAGQQFRHDYGGIIVAGSLLFSLVVSPVAAGLMAFSNLFPWCRKR